VDRRLRPAACLCALAAAACGYRSPYTIERDYARNQLAPVPVRPQQVLEREASLSVASVIAYADADYRRNLHWARTFESLIARANALLEPEFGVRLEIKEVRVWSRSAPIEDMAAALDELERTNAGGDSDFVIGLSGAVPLVTASFDRLGMANLRRRAFLLRALDDAQEMAEFSKVFRTLSSEELEKLGRDRLQHKELVVFLHEWGHALGVPHLNDAGSFMSPFYDRTLSSFGAQGSRLIRQELPLALERRRASPQRRSAREASPARSVEAQPQERTGPGREESPAAPPGGSREAARPTVTLPPEETRSFNAAVGLARSGQYGQAFGRLEAMRAPDGHPAVLLLACQIGAMPGAGIGERAWVACRRAAALAPASAQPLLLLANLLLGAQDRDGAMEAAEQAAQRLERQPGADPDQWEEVAGVFQRLGAPSGAERVAEHAGPLRRRALLEWAQWLRHRVCLPAPPSEAAIPAAQEPEVVDAQRRAWELLRRARVDEARALVSEALRRVPAGPPLHALQCEIDWRAGRRAKARAACEAALAAYAECLPALHIAGAIALQEGALGRAEAHLRKAVSLAPDEPSAWKTLAAVLRAQGRTRELADLQERQRRQFSDVLE
jgi:tetratricopeptide (TPR) repeat protein